MFKLFILFFIQSERLVADYTVPLGIPMGAPGLNPVGTVLISRYSGVYSI